MKNTHFFGQPVFSQLLSLVDKTILSQVRSKHHSDRYYKKFDTWQHLVTMLFCSFSGATSLRELSTGLLAWQNKLIHIGMPASPKRSTISDGNSKRPSEVFKDIYMRLFEKYRHVLPDSRLKMEVINQLEVRNMLPAKEKHYILTLSFFNKFSRSPYTPHTIECKLP